MSNQDNSELIEIVLGLLEKSKQQDESIQKAIKALESEKNTLQAFRNDLRGQVVHQVGESVKTALDESKNALETQIKRIGGATAHLQQVKKDLDWRNNLWYFGGFGVLVAFFFAFALWFIPSLDEIAERKTAYERNDRLTRLQVSNCDKQLCVKVNPKKCGYGDPKKGEYYCIADLK